MVFLQFFNISIGIHYHNKTSTSVTQLSPMYSELYIYWYFFTVILLAIWKRCLYDNEFTCSLKKIRHWQVIWSSSLSYLGFPRKQGLNKNTSATITSLEWDHKRTRISQGGGVGIKNWHISSRYDCSLSRTRAGRGEKRENSFLLWFF